MKNGILVIVLVTLFFSCNNKPDSPFSYAFENLKGKSASIIVKENTKGVVFFFLVPDCPFSQYYTMAISQVYSQYFTKDFRFYGIVPGDLYSFNEIDSFRINYNFIPEILIDKKYNLTKKYDVKVVPQVVVTDKDGFVLYSGKIDDQAIQAGQKKYQPTQFYLLDALKNISLGKPVAVKKTEAVGCFIE